ncbi:putative reverse transcriptase domain-containing protein, partial [Tanacetum coccineum]
MQNVGPNSPLPTQDVISARNVPGKPSYATISGKPNGKKVNVRTLFTPGGNGIDVVVSVDSIRAICERFANTAYGFFLGKKVAYPVFANYVRNTWGKYGLVRSMFSSSTRLFSFQFSSIDGLDAMLEIGPWFIWNNPLILKKWHPDENLLKEDVNTVPVWVKIHGVPVTAVTPRKFP